MMETVEMRSGTELKGLICGVEFEVRRMGEIRKEMKFELNTGLELFDFISAGDVPY